MSPIRLIPRILAAACCAVPLGLSERAAGEEDAAPQITEVRAGIGGTAKVGRWSSVWVTVRAGSEPFHGSLELTVPDGAGLPSMYRYDQRSLIDLKPGETQVVEAPLRVGRPNTLFQIRLVDDSGTTIVAASSDNVRTVRTSQHLIAAIGEDVGLVDAITNLPGDASDPAQAVLIETAADLPSQWLGYEGLSALVVSSGSMDVLDQASTQQLQAIDDWVRLGGRLIISIGSSAELLIGEGAPLNALSPGTLRRVAREPDIGGLETFADAATRLDAVDSGRPAAVKLVLFDDLVGKVAAQANTTGDDRPLVIRSPRGLGSVVTLCVDVNEPPLREWTDRGRLLAQLIDLSLMESRPDEDSSERRTLATAGYQDISGQMRGALMQFPDIRLVPFSWVAALIAVFVLLIGPGDFLLLRRFRGRMHWTWFTFPLVALLFAGTAVALSVSSRGKADRINQFSVVDLDLVTGTSRGVGWFQVYSPENERFSFQVSGTSELPIENAALTWQGLAGEALGGMDSATSMTAIERGYTIDAQSGEEARLQLRLGNVPIPFGGTKGLLAQTWGKTNLDADYDLTFSTRGALSGDFVNPLAVELSDCLLFHDTVVYSLGDIRPGQRIRIDSENFRDVRRLLTQRRIIDAREVTSSWEANQIDDPHRIAQIMLFHEAAGGRSYTGLLQRHQAEVDLSHLLPLDRAVLVGRLKDPPLHLLRPDDGEKAEPISPDQHWSYVRIVFPTRPAQ